MSWGLSGLSWSWLSWAVRSSARFDPSDTSSLFLSSSGSRASRFTCRLRQFWACYARVACTAVAIGYGSFCILGEWHYALGSWHTVFPHEQYRQFVLARHYFPLNHWFRTQPAYLAATHHEGVAKWIAIEELEWVDKINPNSADILFNLAAIKLHRGDRAGAAVYVARLRALHQNVTVHNDTLPPIGGTP